MKNAALLAEIVAMVAQMEADNCYRGDGVLCTCGKSEENYRRLLELCGVECKHEN